MLHLMSAGASTSSLSRMASTASSASINQSIVGNLSNQETPFAQQFNYHLQDLAIVRRKEPAKPDGKLVVHLPDITSVEVEYNRRESVEQFRERLQAAIPEQPVSEYHLVTPRGRIEDGMTLDEYFLTPGSDILMIRKGIKNRQQLANRRFWLKSRAKAIKGEERPATCSIPRVNLRKHPITPYRGTRETIGQLPNLGESPRRL